MNKDQIGSDPKDSRRASAGSKRGRPVEKPEVDLPDDAADVTTLPAIGPDGKARTRRWGPLELIEKLGEGGFGSVYRAWDPRLRREVALKLLHPSIGSTKSSIQREGRLLARIRHENVATVFDVAEHDGVVGLWMEFISGRSLEQLLRSNGPFGAREAAGIGIELCSALRAVHSAGLVHRDITAKNAIREEGGRIVLVDFGLGVHQATTANGDTTPGFAGTPVYMAPEMLRGKKASVATDVYALGVLLYHLVTGDYPVPGSDLAWLKEQHGRGDTLLLRDHRSDIPESFCAIVEKAIAPDPRRRFQSVGELQVALERFWKPDAVGPERHLRTKWLVWCGAGLALLVLVLAVAFVIRSVLHDVPRGSKLVLADIENKTNDEQLNGVTALLRSQLSQMPSFDLLEPSIVKEVLERMVRPPDVPLTLDLVREVAWREGADLVVAGDLSRIGSSYVLNLQIERVSDDPGSPEGNWTKTFRAVDKQRLFEVIDDSGAWIGTIVGQASAEEREQRTLPSRDATTASWEALSLFSKAQERSESGHPEDAVLLLREAVRIDPQFALARMREGDILISLGRHGEGYHAWQRALEAVASRRLTRREELRIEGLYAFDTNDFNAAEKIFRSFSLQYPHDYYPLFMHAFALRAQGGYAEAVEEFEQAAKRRPTLFHIPAQLARTWMLLGKLDPAAAQAARLRDLGYNEWALVMEGSCQFLAAKFSDAESRFRQLIRSEKPQWKSEGYGLLAYMLGELGRSREAIEILEQGILHDSQYELNSGKADKLIAKAYLSYQLGDLASCRSACLEAVDLEAGPLRLARTGSLLARAGYLNDAERVLQRLGDEMQSPVFSLARNRIRGEIFIARKVYPEAIRLFKEAERLEPFYSTKEYLARALADAGRTAEALDQYIVIKDSPARFWQTPQAEFPGSWADALYRCAEIAESLDRPAVSRESRAIYQNLRSPDGRLQR